MTGDAFTDRVAALHRDERAALVAAVYDARGWAVIRHGDEVVATPPGSARPRRFTVTAEGATVATRGDDAPLDAAELRELLTYALDPTDRGRLCRRFFDADPDDLWSIDGCDGATIAEDDGDDASAGTVEAGDGGANDGVAGDPGTASRGAAATDRGRAGADGENGENGGDGSATGGGPTSGERGRRVLLVGAAVALVVGSIAAAAGPTFAPAVDAGTDADGANETDTPGVGSDGTVGASFSPGVDDEGVTSAISVAGAHAEALAGRSYRIHILHREYVDGRLRGVAEERIAVESTDRYRSRVRVVGAVEHTSPLVAEESVYANGTALYARPVDGLDTSESDRSVRKTTRETTTPNRVVDRSRRYVRWYLGVEESRVVGHATRGGRGQVRVALEGDSWSGSRNVTGEARIDERGLVRSIRRESTPTGEPSVRVVVTVRVTPEPVTVTRPAWADRTESDAGAGGPTPTTTTVRSNTTESATRRVRP
ncbi:hypothetical protein [Haloplanus salilacus]|uniref:hypothetical protein n=1 Tax=Haloplanus salilacus TaxID=2949994 RepID=UPI0030CED6BC